MQQRKLAFCLALLLYLCSHNAWSFETANRAHSRHGRFVTCVYPIKDLARRSGDSDQFDPQPLIAHIRSSIDPQTWTVEVDTFRHEGFALEPASTITQDDEHRCLVVRTTVRNHRAIAAYLKQLRANGVDALSP